MAAALPLLARHGPLDLSLDEVAARAGVTRNLLYHYFPRGRTDLIAAVIAEAERQLWPAGAGQESAEETLSRLLDHALAPTHAWRIHRMAGALGGPEISRLAERSADRTIRAIAAMRTPGGEPSPPAALTLRGYAAFSEAVLDGARAAGASRAEILELLGRTLTALGAGE